MLTPATAFHRKLAPGTHRPLGRRGYPRWLADAALYAALITLSTIVASRVWGIEPPPLQSLLRFEALGVAAYVAILALLHVYDQPVAVSVRGEVARSAWAVSVGVGGGLGVLLLGLSDLGVVPPSLMSLPLAVVLGAATRVAISPRAAPARPALKTRAPAAPVLDATDLPRLMQALARHLVSVCSVEGVRIFTRSSDGGALVLRGAALREAGAKQIPSRLRIPIARVGALDLVLSDPGWTHVPDGSEDADALAAIGGVLCDGEPRGPVALAALRVSDGPVGLVCVELSSADSPATRDERLRVIAAGLAEQTALIESALRLRALGSAGSAWWRMLRDLPYGVAVANTATRVLALNGAAEALLNGADAGLRGRRLCAGDEDCACPLHSALRTGAAQQADAHTLFGLDAVVPRPDINVRPIAGAAGTPELLLLVLDPAAGRSHGAEPPVGAEVSAMISHELRAPLATLRMASELALEDDIDPDERRELLSRISRQVTRLDTLVQELADIFRLGSGQLQLRRELVDVRAICDAVVAGCQESAAGTHHLVVEQAGELAPIQAEPLKVRTIVGNIVGNAIKYSPAGTTITVRLEALADHVQVTVEDQGPGVPAEHLPHIFDQFYRVNPGEGRPKGYGLGLFITRKLVELHGGRIWAESEPGRGSSFAFVLPLATREGDAARPPRARRAPTTPSPRARHPRAVRARAGTAAG